MTAAASNASPYYTFPQWMIDHYGEILHRVPLDLGFGCPNRGRDGAGGCTFCAEDGGRAQQILSAETLECQIDQGIHFARRRYGAQAFMAYVQAFTGTFAPESEQRRLINGILDRFPFRALSIGTRPDCLHDETISVLCELRKRLDVWVEVGLQTSHDETLRAIRRGHTWEQSCAALRRLHAAGLRTAVHLITGLPGETPAHVRATADALGALPFGGIKIHNLHVLRNTALAVQTSGVHVPDEFEHAEMVIDILRRIPPGVAVMRVQTDSPDADRIAPRWTMTKGRFAEFVETQMRLREVRQGDLRAGTPPPPQTAEFAATETGDGSITFWNPAFHEHYHAPPGAYTEAAAKYVRPSRLGDRLARGDVRLLDICFGLGTNTLAACCEAAGHPEHALHVTALEADRRVLRAAAAQFRCPPINNTATPWTEDAWRRLLQRLWNDGQAQSANVAIRMLWGDARYTIRHADSGAAPYDIVFLDPFSTQRNSELWTADFFRRILEVMAADGVLLTYSTAKPVLAGLLEAGFAVGFTAPEGNHRPACMASPDADQLPTRLPPAVAEALRSTTGGIPYRDPHQTATNRDILRARQERVHHWKNST